MLRVRHTQRCLATLSNSFATLSNSSATLSNSFTIQRDALDLTTPSKNNLGFGFPKCLPSVLAQGRCAPTGEWRHASFPSTLVAALRPNVFSLYNAFSTTAKAFPTRPCLGRITGQSVRFDCYAEVRTSVLRLSEALSRVCAVQKGDRVAIYARNCDHWVRSELALMARGAIPVALYDTLGVDAASYCVDHAGTKVVMCERAKLENALQMAAKCDVMEHIVLFGDAETGGFDAPVDVEHGSMVKVGERSVTVHFVDDLIASADPAVAHDGAEDALPQVKGEDVALIMYTSGTTGTPKGVVHTHDSMTAATAGVTLMVGGNQSDVHISYLPLAHIFERVAVFSFLQTGAQIAFYRGDVQKLVDDIQIVKPTILLGVPRVFERIEDRVLGESKGLVGFLMQKVIASSQAALERGQRKPPAWTDLLTRRVRDRFGGKVRMMLSGGAPLSGDSLRNLRHLFGVPLLQGYGLTETAAICTISHPYDPVTGHAGYPVPCAEVKLRPVPENGYSDVTTQGGEVMIKGPCVASGYFRNEKLTKADFGADGWFATGDIGRFDERGTLKLVDRLKNMFKTSLGEYIAAEKIETELKKSRFVIQVFIHGDPETPFVIAVVVVEPTQVLAWAKENGHAGELADLIKLPELKALVSADLRRVGVDAQLQTFELPKDVILDHEDWTVDNHMLTPSFKLKRHFLAEKYADSIAASIAARAAKKAAKH